MIVATRAARMFSVLVILGVRINLQKALGKDDLGRKIACHLAGTHVVLSAHSTIPCSDGTLSAFRWSNLALSSEHACTRDWCKIYMTLLSI